MKISTTLTTAALLAISFLQMNCASTATMTPEVTPGEDPDPNRFAEAIDRFTLMDQETEIPDRPVVFVGSSSIRMWPTSEYFPDMPVLNRGFGGSQISDVLHFADRIVIPYEPSVVVFYAGDNDMSAGKSANRVLADYMRFVMLVRKTVPDARFIYVPIKPSLARWELWPDMDASNKMVDDWSSADPRLYYVDTASPMLMADGTPDPELFIADGLHMTRKGYDIWSSELGPVLIVAIDQR